MPLHNSCMTGRGAIAGVDAGTAELEDLAGIGDSGAMSYSPAE